MVSYWHPRRVHSGRVPAPEQVVYTAAGSTILKEIVLTNTDRSPRGQGASVDVAVSVLGPSGTPGPEHRVVDTTLAAGETVVLSLSTAMADGDRLALRASAPDRATAHVTVVERTPS